MLYLHIFHPMNTSTATKAENSTHITAFDTVRGLAALSHRWEELPSITFGKSLPKRFQTWKLCRWQSTQGVKGK
jgi:hypothetical protein